MDLVMPGSPATATQIKQAMQQVKALGLRVRFRTTGPRPSLKQKFQLLKQALAAEDSKVVWCIRGGYGSQKLMPLVLRMRQPKKPKLFIGYSDITVLQMFMVHQWHWPVLHFPVLVDIPGILKKDFQQLKHIVQNYLKKNKSQKWQVFTKLKILNPGCLRDKNFTIKSSVTGGNMTIIQSSIGTPWAGQFKNKILFLEDKGEAPYRVDRALWQMKNTGCFKGDEGFGTGGFYL